MPNIKQVIAIAEKEKHLFQNRLLISSTRDSNAALEKTPTRMDVYHSPHELLVYPITIRVLN